MQRSRDKCLVCLQCTNQRRLNNACAWYAKNRMSVLCKIGFPAVSQNEFAAAFPQGNDDFPAVFAGLFLDVVGMYSWSDVNVY